MDFVWNDCPQFFNSDVYSESMWILTSLIVVCKGSRRQLDMRLATLAHKFWFLTVVYLAPFGAETCINPHASFSDIQALCVCCYFLFHLQSQVVFLLFACELSPNPLFDSASNAASRRCIVISKYHAMIRHCENRRPLTRRNQRISTAGVTTS